VYSLDKVNKITHIRGSYSLSFRLTSPKLLNEFQLNLVSGKLHKYCTALTSYYTDSAVQKVLISNNTVQFLDVAAEQRVRGRVVGDKILGTLAHKL
jgi:hypothetical protein